MKITGIIPSRFKSSRFPGKPLADISGRPMIWHVYQQCMKVSDFEAVYVATDDDAIFKTCRSLGMNVLMTSEQCMTGTDRVAEAAMNIPADLIVDIQGDEPLLEPETIRAAITPFYHDDSLQVTNLMTEITDPVDAINPTVPKVIAARDGRAIYLTRALAPFPKGSTGYKFYKQVCVYGFRPEALRFFYDYGRKYGKAKIEAIEDIEILRFIENGIPVKYIEVNSDTIAVDTPKDLERVRAVFASRTLHEQHQTS